MYRRWTLAPGAPFRLNHETVPVDSSGLIPLLLTFGLLGIGCLALLEKLIPIVPSYVLLTFLGMTAVDRRALALTLVVTTIGSIGGSLAWYGLGRSLGSARIERLVARAGRYIFLSPAHYQRLSQAYRRNHFWVSAIGQTMPTVRVYLALPAGVLALDARVFVLATMVGAVAWNLPFLTLGYVLRDSGRDPVTVGIWVAVGLVVAECALLATVAVIRKRRAAARDAALAAAASAEAPAVRDAQEA